MNGIKPDEAICGDHQPHCQFIGIFFPATSLSSLISPELREKAGQLLWH